MTTVLDQILREIGEERETLRRERDEACRQRDELLEAIEAHEAAPWQPTTECLALYDTAKRIREGNGDA